MLDAADRSLIISMTELMVREGGTLQKSMNFRDDGIRLSVFLLLPRIEGYTDVWDADTNTLMFEGHDSIAEGAQGRNDHQLLMYASGKPTENGRFYTVAQAYKDGMRAEPLQVQVYEKIDAGVFFDKGIFNLVDATYGKAERDLRKVARFILSPVDTVLPLRERILWDERMLPASVKAEAWQKDGGRCTVCSEQSELHFDVCEGCPILHCSAHLVSNQ